MREIYFACSIRGGRDDAEMYAELVQYIKSKAVVLSEIFADGRLTTQGMNRPSRDIWRNDTGWVKKADGIIAEVTNPSLGVGYEIAFAESLGKPILALYRQIDDRKLSAMIDGAPGVEVVSYHELVEAKEAIDRFLDRLLP